MLDRKQGTLLSAVLIVLKLLLLLLLICSAGLHASGSDDAKKPVLIIHAGEHSDNDYVLQLLAAALLQSGNHYAPKALGYFPPRGRDFVMMEQNQGIDIMWGSARADREERFRTIRIPIFKGLIGWRIPLLTEQNTHLFKATRNLDDLAAYRPGQHFRWTDTKILKSNGINVFEANNHASLMGMLINDKFDYYPRAVIEIIPEFEKFKTQGVIIDSHIIISYPSAFYFYVRKDNHALANNLTEGLESLIASGDMNTLFFKHFGPVLKELAVHKRKLLRLDNPFIPDKAPFDRKELWLDPENLAAAMTE